MNKRILIIDDEKEIQNDYLLILSDQSDDPLASLGALEETLFGDEAPQVIDEEIYDVTVSSQGEEGVEHVRKSLEEENPFAVAFIDMRMPPGIDGLETSKQIRQQDPDIEIVIVTAYSDRPRIDIVNEVGTPSKLIYLKKPFDSEEIKQLARALMEKWNLNQKERNKKREVVKILHSISQMKNIGLDDLKKLLAFILTQTIGFFDLEDGFVIAYDGTDFEHILGVGRYTGDEIMETESFQALFPELRASEDSEKLLYIREYCVIPFYIVEYRKIFLVIDAHLREETDTELLKIFIQNAAAAMNNAVMFQHARDSKLRRIFSSIETANGNELTLNDLTTFAQSFKNELSSLAHQSSQLPVGLQKVVANIIDYIETMCSIARSEEKVS